MEANGNGGTGRGAEGELVGFDDLEIARVVAAGPGVGGRQGRAGYVRNELGNVGEDFGDEAGFKVEGGLVEDRCYAARIKLEAGFEGDAEDASEDDAF